MSRRTRPPRGLPPLRCCATAKTTGKPCRRWATVGAVVCTSHGAAARQVEAKAEVRVTLAQLLSEGRDPRVALLDAVQSADAFFREGKLRLAAGEVFTAEELDRHLGHLTRLAALAKVAVDSKLVEVETQRLQVAAGGAAELLSHIVERMIDRLDVAPGERAGWREWASAVCHSELSLIEEPRRAVAFPEIPRRATDAALSVHVHGQAPALAGHVVPGPVGSGVYGPLSPAPAGADWVEADSADGKALVARLAAAEPR